MGYVEFHICRFLLCAALLIHVQGGEGSAQIQGVTAASKSQACTYQGQDTTAQFYFGGCSVFSAASSALTILQGHHSNGALVEPARRILSATSTTTMSTQRGPWKCKKCRKMCGTGAVYCQKCGGHWEETWDRSSQVADSWDGWYQERPNRRPSPRGNRSPRGGQDKGKGTDKGGGKQQTKGTKDAGKDAARYAVPAWQEPAVPWISESSRTLVPRGKRPRHQPQIHGWKRSWLH